MQLQWQPKEWDGPKQFEDCDTQSLMMLPTDMALREDEAFRVHAQRYVTEGLLSLRPGVQYKLSVSVLSTEGCLLRCLLRQLVKHSGSTEMSTECCTHRAICNVYY